MTLGEMLTLEIRRSGLRREEVADLAGVAPLTLRKVLNDDERVLLETVHSVARALGKKIKFTLEG